jgi:DNA-binding response OmpR family regulator
MSTEIKQTSDRILLADDDPLVRHLIAAVIKKSGFIPVTVNDGRDAYRLLQVDSDFRAAIFDMMMPYLKGLDIIRYMRTEKRLMRIPVMLVTSERDLSVMTNSFASGAKLFLPKPFTTEQLEATLGMLVGASAEV